MNTQQSCDVPSGVSMGLFLDLTLFYTLAQIVTVRTIPVPVFTIEAPSGWRLTDGPVQYQLNTKDPTAVNVTANCTVISSNSQQSSVYDWSHNLTFTQTFPLSGQYNTTLTCANGENQKISSHDIQIVTGDVPIKSLSAVVPGYVLVGTPVNVTVSAEEGTDILYRVTPGAALSRWILTSGRDTTQSIAHTFTKAGKTTVEVTATNEVSFAQARPKTYVIQPVTGFRLMSSHVIASRDDIVTLSLVYPSSHLFPMGPLRVELFDDHDPITQRKSIAEKPSGTIVLLTRNFSLGEHTLEAQVASPLDEQHLFVTVTVINPITDFNASDVTFHVDDVVPMNSSQTQTNITVTMSIPGINNTVPPPLGVHVTWEFGDSTTEADFIRRWTKQHSYTARGNYTIRALTRLTGVTDTHTANLTTRVGVLEVDVSPLIGIAGLDIFTCSVAGASGSFVYYQVDFGDEHQMYLNKNNVTEYDVVTFENVLRKTGSHVVQVLARSDDFAEEIVFGNLLRVYMAVTDFTVDWDKHVITKLPFMADFSLMMNAMPTNATCLLEFGDGQNATVLLKEPTHTTTTEGQDTSSLLTQTTEYESTSWQTTDPTEMVTFPQTSTTPVSNQTNLTTHTNVPTTGTPATTSSPAQSTVAPTVTISIRVGHNYTQFASYSLDVSCFNAVSNVSRQWTVNVQRAAATSAIHGKWEIWLVLVSSVVWSPVYELI